MRILIYGINYFPELTGIGKYSGEMAEWLAAKGHDVRVVAAPPYYPAWKVDSGYSALKYRTEVLKGVKVMRCPVWVPQDPKPLTRLLHLMSFAIFSIPQLLRNGFWKPDLIFCIAPTLFCAPNALLFSRFTGAKSLLHIQDFEIDAMFGLGMIGAGKIFVRAAYGIESFLYRLFDRVSTISQSMCGRLEQKGVNKDDIILFPNWVDTRFLNPHADKKKYRDMWGFNDGDRVILYSGNLGKKQGLEILLEVARSLRHRSNYHFVVVGEGAHKQTLMDEAERSGVKNVHFHPLQSYEFLPDLLCMADIHLVLQKKGAADAVMPSKLTGILSVGGHAIITSEEDTEIGRLVLQNPGIAVLAPPENAAALETAIVACAEKTFRAGGPGYNVIARRYAEENLGMDSVLSKLESQCATLAGRHNAAHGTAL